MVEGAGHAFEAGGGGEEEPAWDLMALHHGELTCRDATGGEAMTTSSEA